MGAENTLSIYLLAAFLILSPLYGATLAQNSRSQKGVVSGKASFEGPDEASQVGQSSQQNKPTGGTVTGHVFIYGKPAPAVPVILISCPQDRIVDNPPT